MPEFLGFKYHLFVTPLEAIHATDQNTSIVLPIMDYSGQFVRVFIRVTFTRVSKTHRGRRQGASNRGLHWPWLGIDASNEV